MQAGWEKLPSGVTGTCEPAPSGLEKGLLLGPGLPPCGPATDIVTCRVSHAKDLMTFPLSWWLLTEEILLPTVQQARHVAWVCVWFHHFLAVWPGQMNEPLWASEVFSPVQWGQNLFGPKLSPHFHLQCQLPWG